MLRKYLLPILATGMFGFAVFHVVGASQDKPTMPPPREPPRSAFAHPVAGAGVVEAQTENISIGSALPGLVTRVPVKVGQSVRKGIPLFELDNRELEAELAVRLADLAAARAQLYKLEAMPRPEEVPPSAARVSEAEANLIEKRDLFKRAERIYRGAAISEEEYVQRQQAYQVAREQLARAKADHELLLAGAWEADQELAAAAVRQAETHVSRIRTELDRLIVRAPVDGEVLQVNVRPGEYAGTPPNKTLIVLGNTDILHVRVDIDEHDIPRFTRGSPARAMLRGSPELAFPLSFVRVEPFVVPKKSLTGDNTERVDTRVLQVIYALKSTDKPVYVGQQLDVFIESNELASRQR